MLKIALTSTGEKSNHGFDLRFGRCRYFLIYEAENGQFQGLKNQGESADGGAGIAAAQQMIDEGVEIVITGHMGPNAFKLMQGSKIKVYQGKEMPCYELLRLYQEGKLPEITEAGPAHHGHS